MSEKGTRKRAKKRGSTQTDLNQLVASLKAENDKLQEENTSLKKELAAAQDEIKQLKSRSAGNRIQLGVSRTPDKEEGEDVESCDEQGKQKKKRDGKKGKKKGSRNTRKSGEKPLMRKESSDYGDMEDNGASTDLTHINLRKGRLEGVFSDCTLSISADNENLPSHAGIVNSHAAVLSCRCEVLEKQIKTLRQRNKRQKKIKTKGLNLDLKGADLTTMNVILDFLHSEKIELSEFKIIDVLLILMAARLYKLERLVWLCEDQILREMTLDNVVPLLKLSDVMKEARVKRFCFTYLLRPDKFPAFVVRREAVTGLGLELFQEVVASNVGTEYKQPIDLPPCPAETLVMDFKKLYVSMEYSDAFVKFSDGTLPFHRAILAAHSNKFLLAFQRNKTDQDMTHVLELGKEQKFAVAMTADAFAALLKYTYYGDTKIKPLVACQLVGFCDYFGLKSLKNVCENKIQRSVENHTVVIRILAVTYLSIMEGRNDMQKLRQQCIGYAVPNLGKLPVHEIHDIEENALTIAVDLLEACKKAV